LSPPEPTTTTTTTTGSDPTLDPDVRALLSRTHEAQQRLSGTMSVAAARRSLEQELATESMPGLRGGETVDLAMDLDGGVVRAARLYRGTSERPAPAVVFAHGGGWCLGGIGTHDPLCRSLADAGGAVFISLDYRLAPEHPHPHGLDDLRGAIDWVICHADELGVDHHRVAVAGDSAGAHLAALAAIGDPRIAFQLLLNPVTDLEMTSASYQQFATGYLLTRAAMEWFTSLYLGPEGGDPDRSLRQVLSPLRLADLSVAPPTLIVTAACDPLRDEGEALAHRLAAAGIDVGLWRLPGLVHGSLLRPVSIRAVPAVIEQIGDYLAEGLVNGRWTTDLFLGDRRHGSSSRLAADAGPSIEVGNDR
jgi:acetyl esterase